MALYLKPTRLPGNPAECPFTPKSGHWPDRRLNSSGVQISQKFCEDSGFYKNFARTLNFARIDKNVMVDFKAAWERKP
jgi:hypothetical protein